MTMMFLVLLSMLVAEHGCVGTLTWTDHGTTKKWTSAAVHGTTDRMIASVYDGEIWEYNYTGEIWSQLDSSYGYNTSNKFNGVSIVGASAQATALVVENLGVRISSSLGGAFGNFVADTELAVGAAAKSDATQILVAIRGAQFEYSADGGGTWNGVGTALNWTAIGADKNLGYVVALEEVGNLWVSTDQGATWSNKSMVHTWSCVAVSGDASKAVAAVTNGVLYVSADQFGTHTTASGPGNQDWSDIAINDDGTLIAAVVSNGKVWISTDSGATFVVETSVASGANQNWVSVSMSESGKTIVAAVTSGNIYTYIAAADVCTSGNANCTCASTYVGCVCDTGTYGDGTNCQACADIADLLPGVLNGSCTDCDGANAADCAVASCDAATETFVDGQGCAESSANYIKADKYTWASSLVMLVFVGVFGRN